MWGTAKNSHLEAQLAEQNDEIASLKAQLEDLKNTPASSVVGVQRYPLELFVPLCLPGGIGQPRKYFDPVSMEKLKASIAKVGVQEPLLVRRGSDGNLEIVSGERRWRCGSDLSLETLPAIEKELSDEEALEIALVANLMRENLNIVEETDSIVALLSLRLRVERDILPPLLMKIRNLRLRYQKSDVEIVETLQAEGVADHSGMIDVKSISQIDVILSEFSLILDSLVNRLIAIKKMPENLLEAVREGRLDFSKADIIRRSGLSSDAQKDLLQEAEGGLAKSALLERVKELKQANTDADGAAEIDPPQQFRQSAQKLYSKKAWKRIQSDTKLKRKFQRLQSLADELLEAIQDQP
jgi:ParB family chromosome partitioning protein